MTIATEGVFFLSAVAVMAAVFLYQLGYRHGYRAYDKEMWKDDGLKFKEWKRTLGECSQRVAGWQSIDADELLGMCRRTYPDPSVEAPRYDVVTEGYDPDKVKR